MRRLRHTASSQNARGYWWLWTGMAAVLCAPVWLPGIPPLSDYYNHLARLYIIGHYRDIAAYRALYDVDVTLAPNLALDLLGLPLVAVLPLAVVAKLFVTAAILLWHLGCALLGRAICGRLTRRALVASFFVYNQQLLHGYVNFIMSMGLCLLVLAFWLDCERWSAWRVVLATVAATEVYIAHLSGFATLGVAVAAMVVTRLSRGARDRGSPARRIDARSVAGAIMLAPGTLLFFAGFLRQAGGHSGDLAFAPVTYNLRDAMTVLTGYSAAVDAVSMAAAGALGVAALAAACSSRGRLGVEPPAMAAGLALVALYWACPSDVATGLEVNVRFALGAYTLLFFAINIQVPPRSRAAILAAALTLLSARTAVTAQHWIDLDREFQAHVRAFEAIEPGASVHLIYFYPRPAVLNAERVRGLALIHSLSFAAVHRRAHVPTLYAIRGQHPLVHRRPMYSEHRFRAGERPDIPWPRVLDRYPYVWACHAPRDVLAPLIARARVAAEVGSCTLYRRQTGP